MKLKTKRLDDNFLGNNSVFINIKKARIFTIFVFVLKTAFYGLNTEPEPEPEPEPES